MNSSMKVAVYHNNNDIRLEDRPIPSISKDEILIKTKSSGICGTDLMEWYRTQKGPRILGHEISGDVIASKSNNFKIGDRVATTHHVPCDNCKFCNENKHTSCETLHTGNYDPGGFSQYVRIPKINTEKGTFKLPDNISYGEATFVEPLACIIRGLRVINTKPNHNILIQGCGVSGLLNIQLAKHLGANVTATDIDDYRLNKAKEYNINVFNSNNLPNIKFDKIIICTGALPAFKQAFNSIERSGTILFFAIPSSNLEMPTLDFWRNEITYTSSYGAAPMDLKQSLNLLKENKINVKDLITHNFSLDKIQEAFQQATQTKNTLKVLIEP